MYSRKSLGGEGRCTEYARSGCGLRQSRAYCDASKLSLDIQSSILKLWLTVSMYDNIEKPQVRVPSQWTGFIIFGKNVINVDIPFILGLYALERVSVL